jgi:hypothetical protein
MSSFSERLSAAKAAPRPTRDVKVMLDREVAAELELLNEKLLKARRSTDKRLGQKSPEAQVEQEIEAAFAKAEDAVEVLRFTQLPGSVWTQITDRCPPRLDVPIDKHYGYNMQAAIKLAAPLSGGRVEVDDEGNETVVELVVIDGNKNTEPVNEWDELFDVISGYEMNLLSSAIYELNEFDPSQRLETVEKRLATRPA